MGTSAMTGFQDKLLLISTASFLAGIICLILGRTVAPVQFDVPGAWASLLIIGAQALVVAWVVYRLTRRRFDARAQGTATSFAAPGPRPPARETLRLPDTRILLTRQPRSAGDPRHVRFQTGALRFRLPIHEGTAAG